MGIEVVTNIFQLKHIEHFTETGMEKIEFGKKGKDKIPMVLAYLNNYIRSKNMRIINVVNANGVGEYFYLTNK